LHAVVELAQSGKLAATPVQEYPKGAANDALMMLQHGRVTGRAVLVS
jgi:D-arabinose 1-dehydrogenase-like Zn-dependent alcohol dehydrogenase